MTLQIGTVRLGRRSAAELDRLLDRARRAAPSYDHVGSTLLGTPPPGGREHLVLREVDGTLAAAATALRGWVAHTGIGARPHPAGTPIDEGTTLLVVVPFGPMELAVPNRIMAVVDDADRYGFVYGTLEGHDEVGEELFLAEVAGRGRIRLTIRVHADAGSAPARAVAPLVRSVSHVAARRYVDAWAAALLRG